MPNTPKRLTPDAVTRWRRKDTWTIYETAFLLCGYEPPADMRAEKQTPDEVREAAENMGRAQIAGRLRTIGPEDENGRKYMLRQRDVIAWAANTYPEILRPAAPAAQNSHTDPLPTVTLPTGTRVVLALHIPKLIASALHPADGPETEQTDAYQLGLATAEHEHTEMLDEAASAGKLNLISYNGRPIPGGFLGAGVFVAISELERYLAGLALPIALRIGEPEVQGAKPPARALQVSEQHAEIVLAQIRAAGYDPMDLPPRVNGRSGVKAEIRTRCQSLQDSQFNRAWKALRITPARIKERE